MSTQSGSPGAFRLGENRRGKLVHEALAKSGIELTSPHRGVWQTDGFTADVRIESDDVIRAFCGVNSHIARAGFARQSQVAGNTRYARHKRTWRILADSRVNGLTHLPESLLQMRTSIEDLLDTNLEMPPAVDRDAAPIKSSESLQAESLQAESLQAALSAGEGIGTEAVETDAGWEIQPQVGRDRVPVEITPWNLGARFQCRILSEMPDGATAAAVIDQAYRFNDRLRFVRLTLHDGRLVAESCLHSEVVTPEWMELSAAVATVSHGVRETLQVIAEQANVAESYAAHFLNDKF